MGSQGGKDERPAVSSTDHVILGTTGPGRPLRRLVFARVIKSWMSEELLEVSDRCKPSKLTLTFESKYTVSMRRVTPCKYSESRLYFSSL